MKSCTVGRLAYLPQSIQHPSRVGQRSGLEAEHLADDALEVLDRLRRLDVHHLLQHPLVVSAGHGRRYLVAEVAQERVARSLPAELKFRLIPPAPI